MTELRKAAFIDRDGVVNVERGFLYRVEEFAFVPGAVDALQRLQSAGYLLVVITNQSGIARGLYTVADYLRLTAHMQRLLLAAGVRLSAVEYCPHLADAQLPEFRLDCDCRKPRPGMLRRAATALDIDMARSILVGDRATDIQAGRNAGVGHCWLVRSGMPLTQQDVDLADGVFDDLAACVRDLSLDDQPTT